MENREEKQNNDIVEGKITTFASPTVLAAILDEQILDEGAVPSKVDLNDKRQNSGMVADSLDASLNDSLDSTKLQESGEVIGDVVDTEEIIGKDHTVSPLGFPERVVDYPKSSTPAQNENPVDEKSKNAEKAPKPRRPQHIIERNKEQIGKRASQRASYAQMHAIKTRNKLDKDKEKKSNVEGDQNLDNTPGFNSESKLDSVERNFNQNPNFPSDLVDQIPHGDTMSNTSADLQQNESYLLENSYSNGTHDLFQNHGPYYDVSQNSRLCDSTHQSSYFDQTGTYSRGYGSAMGYLSQKPVPPLYHQSLSTQSAPPGVYGYERKPLINSLHTSNFSEEGYYQSTVLPHNESDKIPESSLHRKFSSDPYLAQSRSTSLQNIANVGRNSKASGSYSNLRQPFEYKPYTLKDYQNLTGSNAKPLAGGLGPNVDTDDFKEKMKKINKQREYATMLRAQHSASKKQWGRKGAASAPVKANHVIEAEKKREAALNYAKNVPKPKQMSRKKRTGSGRHKEETGGDEEQEITVLEILRMRHEQEKKEVDIIRKELASKIRL